MLKSLKPCWSSWLTVVLVAAVVAFSAIEVSRLYLEHTYKEVLENEVKRKAFEVTSQTLQGNIMGSVANLGLVNQAMKNVALGKVALDDPVVMSTLQAVGELYDANGVYVVRGDGIIQSCYYTMGKTLTGVDVKFRPYFQIAKQNKQNIYAAIGTTTGKRSLYFAAPLYEKVSSASPIIGATVARLNLDRVDSVLKAWKGHALLLSPQKITFASDRDEWIERMASDPTPEALQEIRELKQFGNSFEKGTPQLLPFNLTHAVVEVEHQRYAVARAPVQWNDPHGDWTLVLLGNLDEQLPWSSRIVIGSSAAILVSILSVVFLIWRRRLQQANAKRLAAEAELKRHANQLGLESQMKSILARITTELHQLTTLDGFAKKLLSEIGAHVGVEYGALYVFDDAEKLLKPAGGYGVTVAQLKTLTLEDGLVGQCAKSMKDIVFTETETSDIRIVCGEVALLPKQIMLLPISHADKLFAVMVVASVKEMSAHQHEFLAQFVQIAGSNLEILLRHLATQAQASLLVQLQHKLQRSEV